ncbi:succinyl-diaminopimelate desuccinylase [Actinocrinis puniceicyclus]|uniref:Succinyl-diaminopimelate desuccinylase n=1 Tax=Actinocrinis puniceicyclus TaxID=977794 RepID=A0A8J7WQF1_9ACTN|nr:succinyl-diaminopimelate desuccinylase [Actinocrinis puniceicyclus]MBS2963630.1 succinyl-diaminopimelate desuccinylase [Actinocrinis puniceicyclus]
MAQAPTAQRDTNPAGSVDLSLDAAQLTAALVDFPSVSGAEKPLADAIERALRELPRLTVDRYGENVVARTHFGRDTRIVLAGHIDTVPIADNVPSRVCGDLIYGCGTSDMKSGVAVQLRLAAAAGAAASPQSAHDLTFVFYDCEEIESARNGLGHVARAHPDWLVGDFGVLLEPTDAVLEGGCQGTLRARVTVAGQRAHSARSWLGSNAIHRAAPILNRLAEYRPREVEVEGLLYREGLNAVGISGGVAGNVIPDECAVVVNFRFAPDRTEEQAAQHVRAVFEGFDVRIVDSAPAARPGLEQPEAARFAARFDVPPRAKYGWTDVARLAALGVPSVNYGPGDPNLAHTRDEHASITKIHETERMLAEWLGLK